MEYQVPGQNQRTENVAYMGYDQIMHIVNAKLRNSMLWMMWGILTTFLTMIGVFMNPAWQMLVMNHYTMILFIEIGVVFFFSMKQLTASLTTLKAMFFSYSILTGLTLSVISMMYSTDILLSAFVGTVGFFTAFALIGKFTKRDLSTIYPYLMAGVIGLVIVMLINMFFHFAGIVNTLISAAGVGIFAVFTAVDVNFIKRRVMAAIDKDPEVMDRIELIGALSLYLDFINIFLYLLRFSRD